MYNVIGALYYQTLTEMHFEELAFRVYHAFGGVDYQRLKGVHIDKLDFECSMRLVTLINKR